jgi:hypothetical protein
MTGCLEMSDCLNNTGQDSFLANEGREQSR